MTTPELNVAVLDDYLSIADTLVPWGELAPDTAVHFFTEPLSASDRAQRLADYDVLVLMRERMPLSAELIAQLPKLQLVVTTGPRNAAIDLRACTDRGIPVLGTRSLPAITVEVAWLLILGLVKRLSANALTASSPSWQNSLPDNLEGRTLGIMGLGTIGRRMATVAQAFGMEVLAWSQNLTEDAAAAAGAIQVGKDELLRRSDILTLHLRLSPRTQGIIGANELRAMQPDALIINTSRAGLIDEQALLKALKEFQIGGAGLDVFSQEPLPRAHSLRALPNVLLTPHLGYVSKQNLTIYYQDVLENIREWRRGRLVRQVVEE